SARRRLAVTPATTGAAQIAAERVNDAALAPAQATVRCRTAFVAVQALRFVLADRMMTRFVGMNPALPTTILSRSAGNANDEQTDGNKN
ncbi:MAG: hypothetical protein ABL898_14935, partial [Hyphomicrobiaceae bacterium]